MKILATVVLTQEQIDGMHDLFDEWRNLGGLSATIGQVSNDAAGRLVIKLGVLDPERAARVVEIIAPVNAGDIEQVCIGRTPATAGKGE